jgi:hypothetical protein
MPPLEIINGRFVIAGRALWGGQVNTAWWMGELSLSAGENTGISITRFAPGMTGAGLTEDLPQLAQRMARDGTPFYHDGPGIWYDRRRDDHTIEARPDGNVKPPFLEMPWARSGIGTAWDGLSKYDLTKFNPWYFDRTREFARLCEQYGLVLYHNLYNCHNLFESQSHWVDFPWRPVNCINDTGLPDYPPVEEHHAIHVGDQFFDISHPVRCDLHHAYIRHNLDQLGDSPNVIFSVGFQFSGPFAFQQFFFDAVAEWENETGRRVRLALITSKDITDAILADPVRTGQAVVVDLRYWQTQPDGVLWAPRGDRNRAFREMTGAQFGPECGDDPPPTTPLRVYKNVRDYRDRFPDKAIVAWHGGTGSVAVLMAGGAQVLMSNPASGQSQGLIAGRTQLDAFIGEYLADKLMHLSPHDGWLTDPDNNWCLANDDGTIVLIYSSAGTKIQLRHDFASPRHSGIWFSPREGMTRPMEPLQPCLAEKEITKPTEEDWLLLLRS